MHIWCENHQIFVIEHFPIGGLNRIETKDNKVLECD